jgi:hypothetical protein
MLQDCLLRDSYGARRPKRAVMDSDRELVAFRAEMNATAVFG